MPAVISTDINKQYGPPTVNTKYSPLAEIVLADSQKPYFSALLTNRLALFSSQALIGTLLLVTENWGTIRDAEAGQSPPLVVISSNRSMWIKAGIEAAQVQLLYFDKGAFDNVSDLDALTARGQQNVSPPLYCPLRIGPNRHVYIVVHSYEYNVYRKNLAGPGITIIGWRFVQPLANPPVPANPRLVGFGASRFAAIQFCKKLRVDANYPWNYAWLLDDNVVALSTFPGFSAIESAMTEMGQRGEEKACAGFLGGTLAYRCVDNIAWAKDLLNKGFGKQTTDMPQRSPQGLVKQASLWNIDYLTRNELNFSPIYIASAEDL